MHNVMINEHYYYFGTFSKPSDNWWTGIYENELKSTEQKIERVKTQASEVKTNKEFVAYRAELSNFQADADRLSGEVLKILDVVEQVDDHARDVNWYTAGRF